MKEGWKICKIGDIAHIRRGLTYSKSDEVDDSNNIVLRSNNIDLSTNKLVYDELKFIHQSINIPEDKYLKKGELLMCMSNGSKVHLGKVALNETDSIYVFGGFMAAISHDNSLIDKFFFYSLITPRFKEYIKSLSDGANINNLKARDIENYTIPIPPLPEQERIVSLLDAEFAKIDAIKANAEKQLKDAKDLFQSKIEDSFSDTSDWDSYNISECFSTINNGANIKQTKGASGLPITRIETLSNGIFNANRLGYADIFDYVKYQKYILNEGDILMSHINSLEFVGRSVVFHNQLPIVIHGMNLLRLVPLSFIDSDFFVYLSKTRKFKNAISEITHKSVNQASFNTTALKAIRITVPSIKIQKKIVDDLDKMQSLCFSLQQNFDTTVTLCNDLKQSILKDIFG